MHLFSMWERSVHYEDGWFILVGDGFHCSVISEQRARNLELGYQHYQASQDTGRGGLDPEIAYRNRGFVVTRDSNGRLQFDKEKFAADKARQVQPPIELKGVVVIPQKIGRFTIDMVSDEAFAGCTELEKIGLPSTVTSIGKKAFYGCSKLEYVYIPEALASIGERAFEGTRLAPEATPTADVQVMGHILVKANPTIRGTYRIPEHVTTIANQAFADCTELAELVVHDGVTDIGESAFEGCTSLAKVRLPGKVESMGINAFKGCSSLTEIAVPEGVDRLKHFNGCTNLNAVSIPASVEEVASDCFTATALMDSFLADKAKQTLVIDRWLIRYRADSQGGLVLDDEIVGIANQNTLNREIVSEHRALKSVHLPKKLAYIGYGAFENTGLAEVKLPQGVQLLGSSCFRGTRIRSITIPSSVKVMETWVLMNCESLERVVFLGDTQVIWPAITGRRDKKPIEIVAPRDSRPYRYAAMYAEEYQLVPVTL